MDSIFQKFDAHSKNALKSAFNLALSFGHKEITPSHILYGLTKEKGSVASQILIKAKIESSEIEKNLNAKNINPPALTDIDLSPDTKKILEKSFLIASLNQHKYVGTEHLLASLIMTRDEILAGIFKQKNLDLSEIQQQVDSILNSTSKFSELANGTDYLSNNNRPYEQNYHHGYSAQASQASALESFGSELTSKKIQKNIDPVIGRQEEIERLIQILARRNKNNPLLLGDPGVGKTAIIEGLAKKIIQGNVPDVLNDKKIYTLDLSLVVAGTSFRGEFENRIKQIVNEIKQDPNIILFIDEIHNIIGAGSATGSMDAANILKPALARGEIRCIGATTLEDYKKNIASDPALERRFQPIHVNQSSIEETIEILRGIKENYELFHAVKIDDDALTAAAELSERYITDRFLPDKAIDLIDEAASAIKVKKPGNSNLKKFKDMKNQLKEIENKKEKAVSAEKFNQALQYRKEEQKISSQLEILEKKADSEIKKTKIKIKAKDIAKIISKITGVPLSELLTAEKNKLLRLEKILSQEIIGQEEALEVIASFIRRARTGITAANRPLGSFIFLGPSGIGKTESAKILAKTVFGNPQSLIKIDMSEFSESFNISKLIGAPAGYIGYKEGAKLTDTVKKRPYSVVLFDEIEKAHPQIFSLLLQIMEDGYLTDGTGKKINFRNTIIIMTSNLGAENFNQQAKLGFQAASRDKKNKLEENLAEIEQDVLKKLKNKFPPEFLSRIDKTIVFKPLTSENLVKIAKLQLEELRQRLLEQGLIIKFENKIAEKIAKLSYSPEIGARAIRKNIQELVENQIANKILSNKENITVKVEKVKK